MSGQRLTEQLQLVFTSAEEAGPSTVVREDAEPVVAKCEPERPAVTNPLMEAVCERENLKKALHRVKANKGSPGVDGMTVEQLPDYLRAHWPQHRDELLRGTYRPSPVRRVEIPKPDGGVRKLGRLSAGAVGASGGSRRAATPGERLPVGRGPRPRNVFRPSEP